MLGCGRALVSLSRTPHLGCRDDAVTPLLPGRLSYDEYILGAINLYLDFINLFLFILRLLVGGGSRD